MKKTYIAPSVLTINFEGEELIATSMTIKENTVTSGWSNQRDASSSIWDNED